MRSFITFIFSIFVLVSCVPKEGKKSTSCKSGTFDHVSKTCIVKSTTSTGGGEAEDPDLDNRAPIPLLDSLFIEEDAAANTYELTFTDFEDDSPIDCRVTQDVDPASDIIEYITFGVGGPTCRCIGGLCYVYIQPKTNLYGISGFHYQIQDAITNWSTSKGVNVTVSAVNDAPEFAVASYAVPTAISEAFDLNPVTGLSFAIPSATDAELDSITYSIYAYPTMGTISNCIGLNGSSNTDLNCDYIPIDSNVNGVDYFSYKACDAFLCSDAFQVSVTITATNDSPIASVATETCSGSEDGNNATFSIVSCSASVTDPDDTNLTVELLSGPTFGATSISGNNFIYTFPDGNINSTNVFAQLGRAVVDSLTYRSCDDDGLCSSIISADVAFTASNDPPLIDLSSAPTNWTYDSFNNVIVYTASESPTMTATTYVVEIPPAIDAEINYGEGGSLTYSYTAEGGLSGTLGAVSFSATPYFSYTPASGNTTETATLFKYKANDGSFDSNEVSVVINVVDTNDVPIVCEYSKFVDANECGINGCLGIGTPVSNIIPAQADLYYFDYGNGLCYKSSSSNTWELIDGSHISDHFINEGDKVIIDNLRVDEGGGDNSEDSEEVYISNIQSTDNNIVMPGNVTFYYNSVEVGTGATASFTLGDGALHSASKSLTIEVLPSSGNYGTATISFEVYDDGPGSQSPSTVSFQVTVNQVSASHKGWENVRAQGVKVNNQGQVKEGHFVCNYSLVKCNSGDDCIGSGDPISNSVAADERYAIYHDTNANKCWYSYDNGGTLSWKAFETVRYLDPNSPTDKLHLLCNISSTDVAPECENIVPSVDNASCIGDDSPVTLGLTPTDKDHYFYDKTNDLCYKSIDTSSVNDWEVYDATNEIDIRWSSFLTYGSGTISGFNVYRRLANGVFDYDEPLNREVLTSTATGYIDNSSNSTFAPVPKTVYYYEVRPIINGIPTDTSGVSKTLRVFSPPKNKVFIHRWVVNKLICSKISSTTDSSNNYRCPYFGPGNIIDGANRYYDFGRDLVVDRFEAGCNYSRPIDCTFDNDQNNDKACVGLSDPNGNVAAVLGKIFYDRSSGICYKNTDGNKTWLSVSSLSGSDPFSDYDSAELPPLVNFTQLEGYNYCKTRFINNGIGLIASVAGNLPTRKEQLAYSFWESGLSDSDISAVETGYSLNASSKCNSSSANGVSDNYTGERIPSSSIIYTIPATDSFVDGNGDSVRSVYTGSDLTSSCSSRFGVQDAIGNVSEWVTDTMQCLNGSCSAYVGPDGNYTMKVCDDHPTASCDPATTYDSYYDYFKIADESSVTGFPTFIGPCNDTSGNDENCNGNIEKWYIKDETYNATKFLFPVGLPVHDKFQTTYPYSPKDVGNTIVDPIISYLMPIGTSSGITVDQLHDDEYIFNTYLVTNGGAASIGAFSTGGSYLSGIGAGVYQMELVNRDGTLDRRVDIGFRCAFPLEYTNYDE